MNESAMDVLKAWQKLRVGNLDGKSYRVMFDEFGWEVTLSWTGRSLSQSVVARESSLATAVVEAVRQYYYHREKGAL